MIIPHTSDEHQLISKTTLFRYFLEPSQKTQLAKVLCQQRKMLFTRHVFYTDFRPWGCDIKYFNMVSSMVEAVVGMGLNLLLSNFPQMRDPLDRFVSRFNFNRELLEKAKSPRILQEAANR